MTAVWRRGAGDAKKERTIQARVAVSLGVSFDRACLALNITPSEATRQALADFVAKAARMQAPEGER